MFDSGPFGATFVVKVRAHFARVEDRFVSSQVSFSAFPADASSLFLAPFRVLRIEVLSEFLFIVAEVDKVGVVVR